MPPCIFHLQGRCRNGDRCPFSHSEPSSGPAAAQMKAAAELFRPDPDTLNTIPCKFHAQGRCNKGKNCPYRHDDDDGELRTGTAHGDDDDDDDDDDKFCIRTFKGAIVHYRDGASVTKILLCCENSSVRLDGLSTDTTSTVVVSLLDELGRELGLPDAVLDNVRLVEAPGAATASAYISTPDTTFPAHLSGWLPTAKPVPPRLPPWASTRRVRCNKLRLTWSGHPRSCEVRFRNSGTASRVRGKFRQGVYTILDTRVTDIDPPPFITSSRLRLSELPHETCKKNVFDSIKAAHDTPLNVDMDPCEEFPRYTASASIKTSLAKVGPLNFMTEPYEHNRVWCAMAQFEHDWDAFEAMKLIEAEGETEFIRGAKVQARLMYTATFRVSTEVHRQVKGLLENVVRGAHLAVLKKKDGVVISLESTNSDDLAKTAGKVEEVVAGKVVESYEEKGGPYWLEELNQTGFGSQVLKAVDQKYKVLLLPNRSKREIHFFGKPSSYEEVRADLIERLTESTVKCHKIELDERIPWATAREGLHQLNGEFGPGTATLDEESSPRVLTVTGSKSQYDRALKLFDSTSNEPECCICWGPADVPCILRCGHSYCAECFTSLCISYATNNDESIVCRGAEDTCKNIIPLDDIQAHLEHDVFEDVLESSLDTYITHRPDEFHFCPTPDCGYIYRPDDEPLGPSDDDSPPSAKHVCPKCVKRICRRCKDQHEGRTCRQCLDGRTFETYKRENAERVKDCPKCHTTVEKNGGCNHITCTGCNVHICWDCLKTFEDGGECYVHMHEVHHDIGLVD